MPAKPRDPARYFAEHPIAFVTAVGGGTIATIGFARKAAKESGLARIGWAVLAIGQAAQVVGVVRARRKGREAARRSEMSVDGHATHSLRARSA